MQADNGGWLTMDADVGFPVGRPQTLVVDVTRHRGRLVRIMTNMRIYWDRILVARRAEAGGAGEDSVWAPSGAPSRAERITEARMVRITPAPPGDSFLFRGA